jgi:DivIVA domain-containing protein
MALSEPLPTERGALIARIKNVTFTPTRLRGGYDERAVDNFLDAVVASLGGSSVPMTAARIRDEMFPQVKFKGGYLMEDVDEFRRLLADAVAQLS